MAGSLFSFLPSLQRIFFIAGCQQKTVALTARQPVPDTSPLFDEPPSSEGTSNRCEVVAGHKKGFQAGKILDNDKQNQKVGYLASYHRDHVKFSHTGKVVCSFCLSFLVSFLCHNIYHMYVTKNTKI